MRKLRRVTEAEVVAEFLKNEFYEQEFHRDRPRFERRRTSVQDPQASRLRKHRDAAAAVGNVDVPVSRAGWREAAALPDSADWQAELPVHPSSPRRSRILPAAWARPGEWACAAACRHAWRPGKRTPP